MKPRPRYGTFRTTMPLSMLGDDRSTTSCGTLSIHREELGGLAMIAPMNVNRDNATSTAHVSHGDMIR
jgi:hypothetical protein